MTETLSYGRQLTALADRFTDDVAVVEVRADGTERDLRWAELEQRANQVARLLETRGLRHGGCAVVALVNSADHLFSTFAAWKLGATVLPLRWDLPPRERTRLFDLARPTVVVGAWKDEPAPTVMPAEIAATTSFDATALPDAVANPARWIATSGSTGRPKLIVTPGPGLVDADPMSAATRAVGVRQRACQLVISPLYHANGFASLEGLLGGQRLILMERFDAALAVELIERHRVNMAIMVPTMLQRIAAMPDIRRRDFSSIESILYGGAPLPTSVARLWLDLVGSEHFFFSYGGTEGIGLAMARGDEWLTHEGTVGRPVACEVRIYNRDRDELPTGKIGDIFMRRVDRTRTFDYMGAEMPETTQDGFTTFGDMGWLDEDGYLYIADRRVDLIISGGANVYPAEVEVALAEHPGVADAVVVGLPDPEWGQRVHAIVEPADPKRPPSHGDLRAHCRSHLAAYKVPKSFELVERIPRTSAGKVNRAVLAADRVRS